jgi:ATPase subunit of ABC transporter with duplicated ATPase domains
LPARQVLERLLIGYDGTLLFVSHDRYFVDALATGLWVLADGMIAAYASNYAGFRARQVRQEATQVRARAASRGTSASGSGQQAARERGELTVNQRRTSEQVEAAIIAAERQIVDLEAALTAASAAADVERIAELAGKYEAERAQVKRLYEEWTEPTG